MSFHLVGYEESIAAVANTDLDAIPDGILTIQNNHIMPQDDRLLQFAWAASATIDRARLVTPETRQVANPYIRPVDASLGPSDDTPVADYRDNPFRLKGLEEIAVEATSTIAMGSEDCFALLGLGRNMSPAPRGQIYTMRGTGTTTLVADRWTLTAITWEQSLPTGTFICVGLGAQSANCIGARLSFDNQADRPGCVGMSAVTNREHQMFRKGGLGAWGMFTSTSLPEVEFLADVADAAQVVYLDFVRVG